MVSPSRRTITIAPNPATTMTPSMIQNADRAPPVEAAGSWLTRYESGIAVGRAADLAKEAGGAEKVDLRGGLMVPGWGDAHVHFVWWAQQMRRIDVSETSTVDEALAKIDEGTYGLCDRCGKPIEKPRLKALPYANLCLKDKQAEERVR